MNKLTILSLGLMTLASVSAETKVGIIGLDTSHAIAFTQIMNVKKDPGVAGFRMTAAYQWGSKDIHSSTNRYPAYIADMRKMGVEIVPSIDELIAKVDVICLETNDGREHLWQAEKVFKAGKPVFIDKPIAHNLEDALKIYELGKRYGAKYFSASALRYSQVAQAARAGAYGRIRGADIIAPAPYEPTHNFYSWYGIHGFEPLVTIMGTGVEKVTCLRNASNDVVSAVWKDGRMGQVRLLREDAYRYSGYLLPEKPKDPKNPLIVYDGYPGYEPLLREIIKFFKTGKAPFPPEETLEIFAMMEAAEMSAKRGGVPVTIAEALTAADEEVAVPNPGFDIGAGTGKVTGWRAVGNWRIERGAGLNAGSGLIWEGENLQTPARLVCPVSGWQAGEAYHFEVWYRTGRFITPERLTSARICVEWFDKAHKWLGGNYSPPVESSSAGLKAEWRRLEGVTRELPAETDSVEMQIYVQEGCSGRIQWDNATIEPLTKPAVEFVACSAYDNTAAAGLVRFGAALNDQGITRVDFAYVSADGRQLHRDGTIVEGAATVSLAASELKLGRQEIVARAFAGELERGRATCAFTRVASLPRRKVDFDNAGRCLVDGKPFFPLGMYASSLDEAQLETYAQGPFNCLAVYGEIRRENLDRYQAAGLKAMVDLRHGVLGTDGAVRAKLDTPEKSCAFLRREVDALRDHPAVLAWYLNDESPATRIPDLRRAYETVRAQDPDHPVWAVMDRLYDLRGFTPTCDVLGVDPYPVPGRPLGDVADYALGAKRLTFGFRPQWNVPQAFDRAWYWKDLVGHSHFPTEDEMRSICWQHVAAGANGLILYSFHDYLRRLDKGEDFDRCWRAACKIGTEVRDRIPLLLADPAPAPLAENKELLCRSWMFEGGVTTLACNLSPTPVNATLRFADGRTRSLSLKPCGYEFFCLASADLPRKR